MPKSIIRLKSFSGLSFDIDYTDIRPTDSPLLCDVVMNPIGALVTMQGSVKRNTTAISSNISALVNYRCKNGAWIVSGVGDGTIQDV